MTPTTSAIRRSAAFTDARRGPRIRYGLALGLTAVGVGAAALLLPLTEAATYAPLLGAVALSVWFGGLGPGLVATALGSIVSLYVLPEPRFSFSLDRREGILGWAVSLVVAVLLTWVAWMLRRGHERAVREADEAERSRERVEHLHAIASDLSIAATPDEVARIVVERAAVALNASGATLGLIEGDWFRFVEPIGDVRQAQLDEGRVPLQAHMVLTTAAREGRLCWADSREQLLSEYPDAEQMPVAETVIAAPLRARGRVIGSLGFIFEQPGRATEANRSLAGLVAEVCGQALERALLFVEERESRSKLERILAVAPRFQSAATTDEIAAAVCSSARESFEVDVAQLWTVRENGDFEIVWRDPETPDISPGTVIPADDFTELPIAIAELRALFVADVPVTLRGLARKHALTTGIRSTLRIPVVVGGRAERLLVLEWKQPEPEPEPGVVALARRFADQAGLALEQAERRRAQTEAARRAEETRRLLDVTAALAAAVTVDDVASVILEQCRASLGSVAGVVLRRLELEHELELVQSQGFEPSALEGWHRFSMDAEVPLAEAVRRNELVVVESVAARDARYPQLAGVPMAPGRGVWLAVPLSVGQRAVGGLALAFDAARRLDRGDLDFVSALARQAGQAFERARLLEGEHEARARAERIAAGLAQLHALSTSLSQALSAAEVVDAVGAQVMAVLGARTVGLYALDNPAGAIELLGVVGDEQDLAAVAQARQDGVGLVAEAVRSAAPVWLERREDWERFPAIVKEPDDARTVGIVPMFVQERPIGALALMLPAGRTVDEEQRRFAETVARQAAQPLERVRLLDAERASRQLAERATERTRRLQRITEALAAAATPREVAAVVAAEGVAALGGDVAEVYVRHDRNGLELLVAAGEHSRGPDRGRREVPGAAVEVVRSGRLLVVESTTELAAGHPGSSSAGDQAVVWAPLMLGGSSLGALSVSFRRPRRFSEEDRALVLTLARQCAQALERARLYELEQAAVARVRRLQEVTAALSQAATPDAVAGTCLEQAALATGADRGVVVFLGGDGSELEIVGSLGYGEDTLAELREASVESESPLSDAARAGAPVWALGGKSPHPALAKAGDRAWAALPLIGRGGTQGALLLAFGQIPELTPEDRDWLVALAGQCAQALERSRLFDDERATRRRSERLQALTAGLSGALTSDDVARVFLDQSTAALETEGAAIALVEAGGDRLQVISWSGTEEQFLPSALPVGSGHPAADAFLERQTFVFASLDDLAAQYPHLVDQARAQGVDAAVFTPLLAGSRALGIALFTWHRARRLTADELAFVATVASQCAQALDRARRYESERTIAETLQRSVLPERLPEIQGAKLAARYLPGTAGVDVGGDWFDVIQLASGRVGLVVGDVVGKGVRAAATMGQLRNALRAFALEQLKPSSAVTRLNRLVDSLSDAPFATLAYLTIDPATRVCRFTVAGHPPPLVRYPDGRAAYLEGGRSLPLGVGLRARYPQAVVELPPGATIVLYTDGLVERRDRPLEDGLEHLRDLLEEAPLEPDALVDHLLDGCFDELEPTDDVAVLAMVLAEVPADALSLRLPSEPASLTTVRDRLREWLAGTDASPDEAKEIVLATWEACANAVEHAQDRTATDFSLEAWCADATIRVRVRDSGRWKQEELRDDRGLGLLLMRSLMESVDVSPGDNGTVVAMERRLGARANGR